MFKKQQLYVIQPNEGSDGINHWVLLEYGEIATWTKDLAFKNSTFFLVAAAKSLQSCPTPCDPIDGSPPGSPVPGILQARTLEWVAISFSNAWKWKVKVKSLSHAWLLATPWTAAYQAPLSMGFFRQEYWSGVPLPSPFFLVRKAIYQRRILKNKFICTISPLLLPLLTCDPSSPLPWSTARASQLASLLSFFLNLGINLGEHTCTHVQWTWVWASSRRCLRIGKPGVLQSMGSQRVGHDWATEQHKRNKSKTKHIGDFPCDLAVKGSPADAGDTNSIPCPGGSHMPWNN